MTSNPDEYKEEVEETPSRIWAHHDSDGLISAYFTQFAYPDKEIKFVEKFGDTSKWRKDDIMCDMRPDNPSIEGIVIDHHFPHSDKRKYTLIPDFPMDKFEHVNAIVPASLIAWREFKDKIPKKDWWKIAIGVSGDGQPELIPTEVFDECPMLLQNVSTSIYQKYGWKVATIPLYKHLSSCINAFLRKGEYDSAINIVKYSENPLDIYSSDDVRIAKEDVNREFQAVLKDASVFSFDENLIVVIFHSKYRMTGFIASALGSDYYHKTIMAINTKDASLSLRGKLATYYKDKLKVIDYLDVDGHGEFKGGKLHKNYHTFIKDLNKLL